MGIFWQCGLESYRSSSDQGMVLGKGDGFGRSGILDEWQQVGVGSAGRMGASYWSYDAVAGRDAMVWCWFDMWGWLWLERSGIRLVGMAERLQNSVVFHGVPQRRWMYLLLGQHERVPCSHH